MLSSVYSGDPFEGGIHSSNDIFFGVFRSAALRVGLLLLKGGIISARYRLAFLADGGVPADGSGLAGDFGILGVAFSNTFEVESDMNFARLGVR